MNKDTMIALAREAGWQYADGDDGYNPLWRFAALVAAHEREECAKVCEELEVQNDFYEVTGNYVAGWSDGTDDCAAAIRSRNKE